MQLHSLRTGQFDEFEEAFAGLNGGHVLVGRGTFDWTLGVLELGSVALMHGRNGGKGVYQGSCVADTYLLFLPLGQQQGLLANGCDMEGARIALFPPGLYNQVPSNAGLDWLALSMHKDVFLPGLACGTRLDVGAGVGFRVGEAGHAARQRLARLLLAAIRVAQSNPEALEAPAAQTTLQNQLVDAATDAIQSMPTAIHGKLGRPRYDRMCVLDRTLQFMDASIEDSIHIGDLCRAAGVSSATLQNVFSEMLGISPHRYLMLRRLHAVRRALRNAHAADSVTSVCGQFGVWDLGRFAALYKRQFGVTPMTTLRQHQAH